MSNFSSIPQTYISSNTIQENALIYKYKPNSNNRFQKNNRFSSQMSYSSSTKNISNKNSYGDDIEKINAEMKLVNREIKIKNREYEIIKKEHDRIAEENVVILNMLDSLISECQEIEDPLEKRAKDIDREDNKTQLLINNLKKKYDLFKKELAKKEETLKKLRENERTIRMFELDDQIKEAKENLIQVRKDQESYINKINGINRKTNKTNQEIKKIINQNNNLKNEKKSFLNKIKNRTRKFRIKKYNIRRKSFFSSKRCRRINELNRKKRK